MKNKTLHLILLIIFANLIGGWQDNSSSITNFYYYKGQPFRLILKHDKLFIKLKDKISESKFTETLSKVSSIAVADKFTPNDKSQFVSLSAGINETDLISLCSRFKTMPEIEYCSPVFSPDNGATLIGVENEIIVQFKPNISQNEINSYLKEKNLTVQTNLSLTGGTSYILKVAQNDFAIDKANELYNSGLANWSEPNLYFTNLICYMPNDPFVG